MIQFPSKQKIIPCMGVTTMRQGSLLLILVTQIPYQLAVRSSSRKKRRRSMMAGTLRGNAEGLIKGNDSGCIDNGGHIAFTLQCSKQDHTGSSGYGSSYSPDSIAGSASYRECFPPDTLQEGNCHSQDDQICLHDSQTEEEMTEAANSKVIQSAVVNEDNPISCLSSSSCETISSSALCTQGLSLWLSIKPSSSSDSIAQQM